MDYLYVLGVQAFLELSLHPSLLSVLVTLVFLVCLVLQDNLNVCW